MTKKLEPQITQITQIFYKKEINKKFLQMFHGPGRPNGIDALLELALLSSEFYPMP